MPTPAEQLGKAAKDIADNAAALDELLGELADDPFAFAMASYPWAEPGPLEPWDGPDDWQKGFFREWGEEIRERGFDPGSGVSVAPILGSIVSGRGVGKSGTVGMACDFITSTRPYCKGTVTANTGPQLETKTWPEIVKWKRLGLTPHWFKITTGRGSMRMIHRADTDALPWRLDAMQWQENRADAFTGQHAPSSTSFYVFDEASGIPRVIIQASEAGLMSGEPMLFMFGNGRRNSGPFYESHHRRRDRFDIRMTVDGRTARMTNHDTIQKNIDEYGIDSDYIRIEVLGLFPNQAAGQFISAALVREAMTRRPSANLTDPLIIGCDVAWEGDDSSVIRIRQGLDAHSFPVERYHGQDPMFLAGRLADLNAKLRPDQIFVDMTGIGAGVVARCLQLEMDNVTGIHNANKSPSKVYHRMGDYMWGELRDWLGRGGGLDDNADLESELTTREYSYDSNNAYVLESKTDLKSRGEASPDDTDALALTFAMRVGPRNIRRTEAAARGEIPSGVVGVDANPYA